MVKLCAVTTTRADYGILRPLLLKLSQQDWVNLRIAISGTHLSKDHGYTLSEIEKDKLNIDTKIAIGVNNSSPIEMSRIMGDVMVRFSEYFAENRPDAIIVLGDRYEILAVSIAASNACIPIIHLHGGETTEGLLDEAFRHSITKMSFLHFTSTEVYRKRVIQMGEAPERVFNVGALGVENALNTKFLDKESFEKSLGFNIFNKPFVVTTFHPVTLEAGNAERQMSELLGAIAERNDINFLITKANADIEGNVINRILDDFGECHSNVCVRASLGLLKYMTALHYSEAVLGNSSSGLIEVPAFKIPTINIGDRQKGRIQASSVINCIPSKESILKALNFALSKEGKELAKNTDSPYGDGSTSNRICETIKEKMLNKSINLMKKFYDIIFNLN